MFDFGAILDNTILTLNEILELARKLSKIETKVSLVEFINTKVKPLNDETVYLDEKEQNYLLFNEIKTKVLQSIKELI